MSGTYIVYPSGQSGGSGGSGTVTQVNSGTGLTGGPITTTGTLSVASVSLTNQVLGNLPVTNLNAGTSANAATFWRGDGTWATPANGSGSSAGTVTQLNTGAGLFGGPVTTTGTISVASVSLTNQVVGILPTANGGSTGTNTGDISLTVVGTTPSANAGSLAGQALTLQPADATHPGVVSTTSQTFVGVKTFSSGLDAGSNNITSVLDPTTPQQAATKNYVDTQLAAFQPLESVTLATAGVNYPGVLVANVLTITATGAISIDGSTPAASARVLIKDQTTTAQNGVYVVTTVGSVGVAPVLTRAADFNTAADANAGNLIPVLNGTVNQRTSWLQTATVVTINTDPIVFLQYSANPSNVPISVGALDSAAASPNGGVIGSSSFFFQSASSANPGIVSSANQTFSGVKTFSSAPNLSSLTASLPLQTDGSKNVIAQAISLSGSGVVGSISLTSQVSGVLPAANMTSAVQLTSASSTYTIQATDNLIYCTGSSFSLIFPTAVGASGKTYSLKHNGVTLLQKYSLNTVSSQTIGGVAGNNTYLLTTPGEALTVFSDGANWQSLQHTASSLPASYVPTFTSFGSVVNPSFFWERHGMFMHIHGQAIFGTPTGTTASISLPSQVTLNSTYLAVSSSNFGVIVGYFTGANGGGGNAYPVLSVIGSSAALLYLGLPTSNQLSAQATNTGFVAGQGFSFLARIPISDWQP